MELNVVARFGYDRPIVAHRMTAHLRIRLEAPVA